MQLLIFIYLAIGDVPCYKTFHLVQLKYGKFYDGVILKGGLLVLGIIFERFSN